MTHKELMDFLSNPLHVLFKTYHPLFELRTGGLDGVKKSRGFEPNPDFSINGHI
jgi:hypothetical protein